MGVDVSGRPDMLLHGRGVDESFSVAMVWRCGCLCFFINFIWAYYVLRTDDQKHFIFITHDQRLTTYVNDNGIQEVDLSLFFISQRQSCTVLKNASHRRLGV